MSKRQLSLLFICSLVPWTIGNGILPLLPIYAIKLGANPSVAGYYLSFAFLSLAAGTSLAGWLSDKLQRRKLLIIIAGVLGVPTVFLMGILTDRQQRHEHTFFRLYNRAFQLVYGFVLLLP